jgi:uncharacterized membrane protein
MSTKRVLIWALLVVLPIPFASWLANAVCARLIRDTVQCVSSMASEWHDYDAIHRCLVYADPSSAQFTLLRVLVLNGFGIPLAILGHHLLKRWLTARRAHLTSTKKILLSTLPVLLPIPIASWVAHSLCASFIMDALQCLSSAPSERLDYEAIHTCLDHTASSSARFTLIRVLIMSGLLIPLALIGQHLLSRYVPTKRA